MTNFKQYLLTEWKLPNIKSVMDYIEQKNYLNTIVSNGKVWFGKDPNNKNTNTKSIPIGALKHLNEKGTYDTFRIFLAFEKGTQTGYAEHFITGGKDFWGIVLNWKGILEDSISSNISLKDAVREVLEHEITHAVDRETIHKYKVGKGLIKPAEKTARLRDVVNTVRNNLRDNKITLNELKDNLRNKSDLHLVKWLNKIPNLDSGVLYIYLQHPEVIQRVRRILYHEFLTSQETTHP